MSFDVPVEGMQKLAEEVGRPVAFMEVCGTHTVSAFRSGLRSLLPESVRLISGPGCPVCVTPTCYLDKAIAIGRQPGVVIATFGDMLRVPGTESSLEREKANGVDIRMVYSPIDAVKIAQDEPEKTVVFLGVGFETTTPAIAWTIKEAKDKGIDNYFVLSAHKTIPEAMAVLVSADDIKIDGFLCPGHVSVITGSDMYKPLVEGCGIPCVVSGFEAYDMARGIEMLLQQLVDKRADAEVEYTRSVTPEGNVTAQQLCSEVFEKCDTEWRGVGLIPGSGLKLAEAYSSVDADVKFAGIEVPETEDHSACKCGEVLRGVCEPSNCPMFGNACTPSNPIGACMVSTEGSCSAHYKYGSHEV